MITHHQLDAALKRRGIHRSADEVSAILNELQPNPVSGFGVNGVMLWGDSFSIKNLRRWYHAATVRLPAIEERLQSLSK